MASNSTITFPQYFVFGREITYYIENAELEIVRHTITFSNSYGDTITNSHPEGEGIGKITIPLEWMVHIPNRTWMQIDVKIITHCESKEYRITQNKTFTASIAGNRSTAEERDRVRPSIYAVSMEKPDVSSPTSDWPCFIPEYDGIKLTLDYEVKYGAKFRHLLCRFNEFHPEIKLTLDENNSCVIDKFLETDGTITLTLEDSRGFAVNYIAAVEQFDYAAPTCSNISCFRCDASGQPDSFGTYCSFTANLAYTAYQNDSNTYNYQSASLYYKKHGSTDEWTLAGVYSNGSTKIFGNGAIGSDSPYDIRLEYEDAINERQVEYTIPSADCSFFVRKGGKAIGLGTTVNEDYAIRIASNWNLYHGEDNVFEKIAQLESLNVLDNSNFRSVIKQDFCEALDTDTGVPTVEDIYPTEYQDNRALFAADRWWCTSGQADKFVFTMSERNTGDPYTGTLMLKAGGSIHQTVDKRYKNMFDDFTPFVETVSGEASIVYDDADGVVTITATTDSELKWAALYPGVLSVPPIYRPKSYNAELRNCQRYRQRISLYNTRIPCSISAAGRVEFSVPLPTPMKSEDISAGFMCSQNIAVYDIEGNSKYHSTEQELAGYKNGYALFRFDYDHSATSGSGSDEEQPEIDSGDSSAIVPAICVYSENPDCAIILYNTEEMIQ